MEMECTLLKTLIHVGFMAANYMGIKSLFDLCCTKVALLCKDKSEEEIFKTLNITETSTEEEKKKI